MFRFLSDRGIRELGLLGGSLARYSTPADLSQILLHLVYFIEMAFGNAEHVGHFSQEAVYTGSVMRHALDVPLGGIGFHGP